MPESYATYLCIDFGLKHMGVAVGSTLTRTAQPLHNLKQHPPNGLHWPDLDTLVNTWQPDGFVVGLPLNMDGSTQALTTHVHTFMAQLKDRYQCPVHYMDERLTTLEAKARLFEQGGYRALKKEAIDCFAAKLILEDWLARL